jgi:hypothetical protein
MRVALPAVLLVLGGLACSNSDDGGTTEEDVEDCPRSLADPERTRAVVASHPYDSDGGAGGDYSLWWLDPFGVLTGAGERFTMGPAENVPSITFTPDGEIGIAVQNDGTLGFFRVTESAVEVIDGDFDGDGAFEAVAVTLDQTGQWLYVMDGRSRAHGGGIYLVHVECDGSPRGLGRLASASAPRAMGWVNGESPMRAVVAAATIGDSGSGSDAHLLELADPRADPTVLLSGDVFAAETAVVGSFAVTRNGRFALLANPGGDSVVVIGIGPTSISPLQPFSIDEPRAIIISPFENAGIVLSKAGNAVHWLSYDPDDLVTPFSGPFEMTYDGALPSRPASAVVIERGSLAGHVLIAERFGIRQARFFENGALTDLGLSSSGAGFTALTGVIGVQP